MRTELSDRWVRGYVGDVAVVNTRAPLLFWEPDFPVPRYAIARSDVRTDLLSPAAEPPAPPSFFRPRTPVAQWYDLQLGGRRLPQVAWTHDDPDLAGHLVLSWEPGLVDRWLEEDEEVAGHPRDPYKRVDALPSSRHVVVALDGVLLAESSNPVLLFETGLPTRYYVPRVDVDFARLAATDNRSHCPYKGDADGYWDVAERRDARNVAWSYSAPFPAVGRIRDRLAFYNELVDLTVDGVPLPRPVSVFSTRAHRPGS